jgi:stage V sporulation protein SpoVS
MTHAMLHMRQPTSPLHCHHCTLKSVHDEENGSVCMLQHAWRHTAQWRHSFMAATVGQQLNSGRLRPCGSSLGSVLPRGHARYTHQCRRPHAVVYSTLERLMQEYAPAHAPGQPGTVKACCACLMCRIHIPPVRQPPPESEKKRPQGLHSRTVSVSLAAAAGVTAGALAGLLRMNGHADVHLSNLKALTKALRVLALTNIFLAEHQSASSFCFAALDPEVRPLCPAFSYMSPYVSPYILPFIIRYLHTDGIRIKCEV